MKHLIILGDGMSDLPVAALGGKTPLEAARTPAMDTLARLGRSGSLLTVPEGFHPGSEVANTSILGYDLNQVYEGRGSLEAASIGYDMQPGDLALRCNLLTLGHDGTIANHHGGHLTTAEGTAIINTLQETLGNERVLFIPGIQYRHLLIIKGGNKHIATIPPHDHPGEPWRPLLPSAPTAQVAGEAAGTSLSASETAQLLRQLITDSQAVIAAHPVTRARLEAGSHDLPTSIWPWSPGYRPAMLTLGQMYPSIRSGAVITAVDLIRGIGRYAGLEPVDVEGATGLADTNYEGKCRAALQALESNDFVFLHIEATDEAGHDGDTDLKVRAIEYLDSRVVGPILKALQERQGEPVAMALLPDHATPVELRVHRAEPVPFTIWHRGIRPDGVTAYSEAACAAGSMGLLGHGEFMQRFMNL